MHDEVQRFVERFHRETLSAKPGRILDVGARRVKKRQWCPRGLLGEGYLAIDFISGDNVDQVMNSHKMSFEDEAFDNVLCVDMLEHDAHPELTIRECLRVLKPGGHLAVAAASPPHAQHYVEECGGHYRNVTASEVSEYTERWKGEVLEVKNNEPFNSPMVYIIARKGEA